MRYYDDEHPGYCDGCGRYDTGDCGCQWCEACENVMLPIDPNEGDEVLIGGKHGWYCKGCVASGAAAKNDAEMAPVVARMTGKG